MKNFQKIALGLLISSMAIGFSAFKKTTTEKADQATQVYYHVGNQYIALSSPPADTDCLPDDYFCTVTLRGTNFPGTFLETNIPASNSNYTVTTQDANRSWQ